MKWKWLPHCNKTFNLLTKILKIKVSVSAYHAVGHGLVPRLGHTKNHHKNCTNCLPVWHACVSVGV